MQSWFLLLHGYSFFFFLKTLYEYVFSMSELQGPYGIFSIFPRSIVTTEMTIAEVGGTIVVEEGEGEGYYDSMALVAFIY